MDGSAAATIDAADLAKGWNLTRKTGGALVDQCQVVLRLVRVKEGTQDERPSVGSIRFEVKMDLQRKKISGQALDDKWKSAVQKMLEHDEAIHQAAQPKARAFELRRVP